MIQISCFIDKFFNSARIALQNSGVLRLYAERHTGLLLGAELCAPGGEHLAHLLGLAIERALTVWELLRMPFYHPVFEEGLRSALRQVVAALPASRDSDLARVLSLPAEGAAIGDARGGIAP